MLTVLLSAKKSPSIALSASGMSYQLLRCRFFLVNSGGFHFFFLVRPAWKYTVLLSNVFVKPGGISLSVSLQGAVWKMLGNN